MLPAHEGFEAEDISFDRGLRLIVQAQFVVGNRRAQIVLQGVPLSEAAIHLGVEKTHHMPALGLGPIERGVGVGLERHDVTGILRVGGRANAETDGDLLAANLKVLRERFEQPIGQRFGCGRLFACRQDEHEFIAADARSEGVPSFGLETPGDCAQELIADHVPEDIVGLFEMIEIDGQDCEALAVCPGVIESLRKTDPESGAVR